jgi:predicted DNA-binding transcriptional regulator AlpA
VKLLSIQGVVAKVTLSKATVYKRMRDQVDPFPQPIRIELLSRWRDDEIDAWIERKTQAARGVTAEHPNCQLVRDSRRSA